VSRVDLGYLRDRSALTVDLPKLISTRMLIQANSGGGKSGTLRLLAERAADKVQTIIFDKEGEFVSLREKLDILIIGETGELPATVATSEVVARRLLETQLSAVIDLSEMPQNEREVYVEKFLHSAIESPRDLWHPALFMIDEAHLFCPQAGPSDCASSKAVIALMSLGRKRGFCGVLATQRLSKLHKDAAAECNNILIGRTTLDNDQVRAGDALGLNKTERVKLRDLETRVFLGFGPAFSTDGIFRFKTAECSTTMPQAGRLIVPPPPSSKLLGVFSSGFSNVPREASERHDELERARTEIARLRLELADPAPVLNVSGTHLTVVCVMCRRVLHVEDDVRAVVNAPVYCDDADCRTPSAKALDSNCLPLTDAGSVDVIRPLSRACYDRDDHSGCAQASCECGCHVQSEIRTAIAACDEALSDFAANGVNGAARAAVDRIHAALWRIGQAHA